VTKNDRKQVSLKHLSTAIAVKERCSVHLHLAYC